MEAEPLIDQITAKTRQDEAWTNEVMGHATGIVGSRPTRKMASIFTLHVVSVDRVGPWSAMVSISTHQDAYCDKANPWSDNAGGSHVGNDDLDVGASDQETRLGVRE